MSHYPYSFTSRVLVSAALALFSLLVWRSAVGSPQTSALSPPSVPGDWPMYGHDLQRTGYNPYETSISASNVGLLTQAWQGPIGIGPALFQAFNSPIVANGRAIIASSTDRGNNLFAFDAVTGVPRWSAFIGYNPQECFGIGIGSTAAISGTTLVIGGGDGAYYGLNTSDGSQIWRDALGVGPSGFAWVSPLVANGRAYVGVASNCDNPSVRGEVRALDITSGAHDGSAYFVPKGYAGAGVWNSPALSPDGSKIVVVSGEDYAGYNGPYNRALMVLDANTLDILASDQEGDPSQDEDWDSTPVIFHDKTGRLMVGAGNKNHVFYAYDLDNVSAGPVWSWEYGLQIGVPPAYDPNVGDGGTLFFCTGQYIYAIDPADGHERWHSTFVGEVGGGVAIANGLVYVNYLGRLKIISETDGRVLRVITPLYSGNVNTSAPVVSYGTVYWTSGAYLNAWHIPPAPTATATPTLCPGCPTPTCSIQFTDVPQGSTFYSYIECLACKGIISGYDDGTFRPNATITRGQTAKIVALASGIGGELGPQVFQDVPPNNPYFNYVGPLAARGIVGGYPCGLRISDFGLRNDDEHDTKSAIRNSQFEEPCIPPANMPYFEPGKGTTRGQIAKVVALAANLQNPVGAQLFEDVPPGSPFYTYTQRLASMGILNGYPCGGLGEPCTPPGNLPYFRPGSGTTRGQLSKIVSITFLPDCDDRLY